MRFGRHALIVALVTAFMTVAPATVPVSAQEGYKLIVNASNPEAELDRETVARIFLKKTAVWTNGKPVSPVDLGESAAARAEFSKAVLRKPVGAVKAFWQSAIFSGRGVPPPEKSSDRDVVAHVRTNPYAIGYVSGDAALGEGVKVVRIRE